MAASVVMHAPEEFLAEVDGDREAIARDVVRVTKVARPILGGGVTRVHVEAAYRVAGEVVRYRFVAGDLWGIGGSDEEVQRRASKAVRRLEEELLERGLKVRAGLYEGGPE